MAVENDVDKLKAYFLDMIAGMKYSAADMKLALDLAIEASGKSGEAFRSPFQVIRDKYGLQLNRFAGDKFVKVVGVLGNGEMVDVSVEKNDGSHIGRVMFDDQDKIHVYGGNKRMVEIICVRSVLEILKERRRTSSSMRRIRARAKTEENGNG